MDSKQHVHRHLQTLWSELAHRIPKFSPKININDNLFLSLSNRSLPTREIKCRVLDIPVYKIDNRRGKLELYSVSKPRLDDDLIHDTPLHNVVEFDGQRGPPVRLVPELSQVKNAIELRNKGRKKGDSSFDGVPVFQSDRLTMNVEGLDENYTPAFFRKEELEKHIEKDRDVIKVSSFEDIIRKMKDSSTSESNDVLFVGPDEVFSIGTVLDGQVKYKMKNHFSCVGTSRGGSIYTVPAKETVLHKTLKLRGSGPPAN